MYKNLTYAGSRDVIVRRLLDWPGSALALVSLGKESGQKISHSLSHSFKYINFV